MKARIAKKIAARISRDRCRAVRSRYRWDGRRGYSRRHIREALKRLNDSLLKILIEKPENVRHWGADYCITPLYVPGKIGDGGRIMFLTPIMTRPNYFVLRFDSQRTVESTDFDLLDQAYDLIEECFGHPDFECDECGHCGCDCDCCSELRHWPCVNLGDGTSWSYWPK